MAFLFLYIYMVPPPPKTYQKHDIIAFAFVNGSHIIHRISSCLSSVRAALFKYYNIFFLCFLQGMRGFAEICCICT